MRLIGTPKAADRAQMRKAARDNLRNLARAERQVRSINYPNEAMREQSLKSIREARARAEQTLKEAEQVTARVRALVGLLIIGGCLLFAFWALFDLVRFGSCASGGPYVSARECAPGTGWKIMGMIASVFGVLIGVGIAGSARAGLAAWGLGFTGLAAHVRARQLRPGRRPDNMPAWASAWAPCSD